MDRIGSKIFSTAREVGSRRGLSAGVISVPDV